MFPPHIAYQSIQDQNKLVLTPKIGLHGLGSGRPAATGTVTPLGEGGKWYVISTCVFLIETYPEFFLLFRQLKSIQALVVNNNYLALVISPTPADQFALTVHHGASEGAPSGIPLG